MDNSCNSDASNDLYGNGFAQFKSQNSPGYPIIVFRIKKDFSTEEIGRVVPIYNADYGVFVYHCVDHNDRILFDSHTDFSKITHLFENYARELSLKESYLNKPP